MAVAINTTLSQPQTSMETNLPSDSGGKETDENAGEQSAKKDKGKGRAAPVMLIFPCTAEMDN